MRIIFRCDPMLIEHLPRPIPARGALPEWLRAMPATAYSAIHGRDIRTLKQCPPVVDAMTYGFMVLLPCDVVVDKGTFSWDWQILEPVTQNHPRAPLSFHTPGQLAGSPFATPGPQIQQLLDHRGRGRLVAVRDASGQSRGSSFQAGDRPGGFRPVQRWRHQFPGGLDGSWVLRRARERNPGRTVLCGSAGGAAAGIRGVRRRTAGVLCAHGR